MSSSDSQFTDPLSKRKKKRGKKPPRSLFHTFREIFFLIIDLNPSEIARHLRRYRNRFNRAKQAYSEEFKSYDQYDNVSSLSAKMKKERMAAMEELNKRRAQIPEEKLIKKDRKPSRGSRSSTSSSRGRKKTSHEQDEEEITTKTPSSVGPFIFKAIGFSILTIGLTVGISYLYNEVLGKKWEPDTDYLVYYEYTAAANQGGKEYLDNIKQIQISANIIEGDEITNLVIMHELGKKIWIRKRNGDIIKKDETKGWIQSSKVDGNIIWNAVPSHFSFLLEHLIYPFHPSHLVTSSETSPVQFIGFKNVSDLLCYELLHKDAEMETTYYAAYRRGLTIQAERQIGSTLCQINFGDFKRVQNYEVPFIMHQYLNGHQVMTIKIRTIEFKTEWKTEETEPNAS
jgi:hypothetical protein